MRSLLSLPDELLLWVIRDIEYYVDAVSFAMTNRHLHAMSELKLRRKYRHVRLRPEPLIFHALQRLIRILKRPQLGEYIHHIEVDWSQWWESRDRCLLDSITPDDTVLLYQAIRDAGIIDQVGDSALDALFSTHVSCFARTFGRKALEVLATLLVSLSPNLISLCCGDLGTYVPRIQTRQEGDQIVQVRNRCPGSLNYLGQFLQRIGQSKSRSRCLQKLRTVRIVPKDGIFGGGQSYYETDYCHAVNVLRHLPAIESVRFDATINAEPSEMVRPPPRSANYSRLAFLHSTLASSVPNDIVLSTKALTHLEISLGGRSMPPGLFCHFSLNELLSTLLLYRDSLEYLDLDIENDVIGSFAFMSEDANLVDPNEHARREAVYQVEWKEELQLLALEGNDRSGTDTKGSGQSMRDLSSLKHLGIGAYSLLAVLGWIDPSQIHQNGNPSTFTEQLPLNLESLRIYGAGATHGEGEKAEGMRCTVDRCLAQLLQEKAMKLPSLSNIQGIVDPVPNGESLSYPRGKRDRAWFMESEAWTDSEDDCSDCV